MGGPEDSWAQLDSRTQRAALKSAPRRQLGNHAAMEDNFQNPDWPQKVNGDEHETVRSRPLLGDAQSLSELTGNWKQMTLGHDVTTSGSCPWRR